MIYNLTYLVSLLFQVGAAFGRMVGEAMHVWFPDGVRYGDQVR